MIRITPLLGGRCLEISNGDSWTNVHYRWLKAEIELASVRFRRVQLIEVLRPFGRSYTVSSGLLCARVLGERSPVSHIGVCGVLTPREQAELAAISGAGVVARHFALTALAEAHEWVTSVCAEQCEED